MKKISVILIVAVIYSAIITNADAQIIRGKNNISYRDLNVESTSYKSSEKIRKAGFKSLKSFNRDFKNDRDVKWFSEPNITTATFTRDEIKTNVVYDNKGHWLRTVKTYQENKLDRSAREIVKSTYFDYHISQIQEIQEGGTKFYLVYLENQNSFKIVAIVDGEMNIYQEYKKQS